MKEEKILVADDDAGIRWVLKKFLTEKGYGVICVSDGEDAILKLKDSSFLLAIIDIKMPGLGGLEVLEEIKRIDRNMPVVIITAQDTMKNAIEAMRRGAFDYLNKPFDLDELEIIIDKAIETWKLQKELSSIKGQWMERFEKETVLIGRAPVMQRLFKRIGRVAGQDVTVLITGESGTGKELIAKAIHLESKRASGPFIPINSAAIPKDLIESELFGFDKGAFTGATADKPGKLELADGGTLFLDEIGDMDIYTQTKILRVLQEKEFYRLGGKRPIRVDVRLIAATHQNLKKAIEEGRFREDLFYRLNVVSLEVPSLRERKDDIPYLVQHFLAIFNRDMGMGEKVLSPEAMECLIQYNWPGNIRELENTLKGAYILTSGSVIMKDSLSFLSHLVKSQADTKREVTGHISPPSQTTRRGKQYTSHTLDVFFTELLQKIVPKAKKHIKGDLYHMVIGGVEKTLIELVLKSTNGNQLQASKILGINRNTLRKKVKELKIKIRDDK